MFSIPWIDRHRMVRQMEFFQDLIVIILCMGLFAIMVIELWEIFRELIHPLDYKQVTAKILFVLILVELFRLLILYLEQHSIAVGVAVEVAIVSILREVIVQGVLEISWIQVASICGLLLILGGLLFVCSRIPHMDHVSGDRHSLSTLTGDVDKQEHDH